MAPVDLFAPALAEMPGAGAAIYGPQGFQEYAAQHGVSAPKTADRISINHYDQLPASLKAAQTMVLRLGAGEGGKTNFALVRVQDVRDFFLFDAQPAAAQTYLSPASMRDLVGYTILRPSETTMVNLAFASGLLAHALGLDDEGALAAPARGVLRSTFTFAAHSTLDHQLTHNNGQVEIDAVFIGRRDRSDIMFVIEAKLSPAPLAKHKLAYPVMAVAPSVPADIPIVPVYIRAQRDDAGYRFHVAECAFPDPRQTLSSLDQLAVLRTSDLTLPLGQLNAG
jgi:hypothetical protein